MFEKLLSLLPYNPGLASQMAFYSQRMRAEASIRRIGVFFLVFAFLIQFVAVIAPPQDTLADSVDNDLITSSNHDLNASKVADACQNDTRGYQKIMHYYGIHCDTIANAPTIDISASARNNSYYSMGHTAIAKDDVDSVTIEGAGTLHIRHLSSFTPSSWSALQVASDSGKTMYILLWCGNLVTVGLPHQSPFIPRAGDTISITGSTGFIPSGSSGASTGTGFSGQPAAPAAPTPEGPAYTPEGPATPPTTTATLLCMYNTQIPDSSPDCPDACPFNSAIPVTNIDRCFCKYNHSIPPGDSSCKPCTKSANAQDTVACIEVSKSATNVTTGTADANNTTAKANDVITYTLYAKNNGKATVKGFVFQENLSDVLDYASVNDFHGGAIDNNTSIVSWPAQDIQPDATASVQITVKVKDPVPQTPAPANDPTGFDLNMNNVYGNAINIKLPGSPAKTIEATTTALPNTGPGTSLFIGGAIVILAGYFYGRARLLAKESNIALKETATSI